MRLQPVRKTKKTLLTIITSNILIVSLLIFSACSNAQNENVDSTSEISQDNSGQAATDHAQSSETVSEYDEYKDTMLPRDIEFCKERLFGGGEFVAEDGIEYDIDHDGQNEFLITFFNTLKIYKKVNNTIFEKSVDKMYYVQDTDLQTMRDFYQNGEQYSYFFHRYEGGVMECYVLKTVKYNSESDEYEVKNEISWGKLDYIGQLAQYTRPFFRKGWNRNDITTGESEDNISQDEFLKIYNKYENLPPWDEFLN